MAKLFIPMAAPEHVRLVASCLGSQEAVDKLMRRHGIPVRRERKVRDRDRQVHGQAASTYSLNLCAGSPQGGTSGKGRPSEVNPPRLIGARFEVALREKPVTRRAPTKLTPAQLARYRESIGWEA